LTRFRLAPRDNSVPGKRSRRKRVSEDLKLARTDSHVRGVRQLTAKCRWPQFARGAVQPAAEMGTRFPRSFDERALDCGIEPGTVVQRAALVVLVHPRVTRLVALAASRVAPRMVGHPKRYAWKLNRYTGTRGKRTAIRFSRSRSGPQAPAAATLRVARLLPVRLAHSRTDARRGQRSKKLEQNQTLC
jgi:hypothetical protein